MMLKSRFVLPVDGPVIEDGAVLIRDGRIDAVGSASQLHDDDVTDYGDAVICPGFVNAHTHLELSSLAKTIPPSPDFTDWLRRLMERLHANPLTRDQVAQSVRLGVKQSVLSGVTTIGDVTREPQWTREFLASLGMRGVSFGEVIAIGKRRAKLAQRLREAMRLDHQTERLRIGISPHAPYTVEPAAMRICAAAARELQAPISIHLAETAAEEAFTRSREGPFAAYLQQLGVWDDAIPASGCSPIELARATGLLGSRTIVAHANYVSDDDIATLAESGAGVAYCPRTHDAFGHVPHRFCAMLQAGVNVCIGTDSLVSNPSLSVLDELRFLRDRHPDVSPDELMAMGTLRGARALGLEHCAGSLTPGKSADLVVVPLDPSTAAVGWAALLESTEQPIAVYIAGVLQDSD
ncbi:MAG: amidohydrolase family protein [Planctomycetes bacterium]|nr:amidohydrolase family protein [Planctomycetota bacterium]